MRDRDPGLDAMQLRHYGKNLAAFWRVALVLAVVVGAGLFFCSPAQAQTPPSMEFSASVTNADGALSTRLSWSTTPAASGCTASGHPAWTGDKPAAGQLDLPAITLSGTYQLTLTCRWPGDSTAELRWSVPTRNTDGTALTNLAGFKIYYGTAPAELTQVVNVANAAATAYLLEGLAPAAWYFSLTAYNSNGVESSRTETVSKTISADADRSSSVTLTVNPIPDAPAGLTVR